MLPEQMSVCSIERLVMSREPFYPCMAEIVSEGGRCMRGMYDGKLCFSETESGRVWNDYMERIIIKESD